jgi:hypothetical protein
MTDTEVSWADEITDVILMTTTTTFVVVFDVNRFYFCTPSNAVADNLILVKCSENYKQKSIKTDGDVIHNWLVDEFGSETIVYVATSDSVDGALDTFDSWKTGKLRKALDANECFEEEE